MLKRLGVPTPVPMTVPVFNTNVAALGIESAVYFDHMTRAGKLTGARGGNRKSAWLTPAVEYLQQQRVRMLMMMKLEEATRGFDVYLVGVEQHRRHARPAGGRGRGTRIRRGSGSRRRAAARRGGRARRLKRDAARTRRGGRGGAGGGAGNPTQRHFTMANLACYPAINVPNGFAANGQPTNVVFYARPFGETELLALAKAYRTRPGSTCGSRRSLARRP